MAKKKKSTLALIYGDLVEALGKVIPTKQVFLKERPKIAEPAATKADAKPMDKFCVIDLPAQIRDYVIGNRKMQLKTTGVIYVFTQGRKNNTLDVNIMGDLVDAICDLFPVSGEFCICVNPTVLMSGADEFGYQVTAISFDIRCRWGVFEKYNNS